MRHRINADGKNGCIGFDIGGVIVGGGRGNGAEDTSVFGDRYLETPEIDGAIEAITRLVKERFGGHAYLVSKCSQRIQDRTEAWLERRRFYDRTGILSMNKRFCRKRHEKGPICRGLGITHFVDDRVEVLNSTDAEVRRYAFRPDPKELERFRTADRPFLVAHEWEDILADLLW
jgi:hypothetical protein